MATVLRIKDSPTRCWMLPRAVALRQSTKMPVAGERRLNISTLMQSCSRWEGHFTLDVSDADAGLIVASGSA